MPWLVVTTLVGVSLGKEGWGVGRPRLARDGALEVFCSSYFRLDTDQD